MANFLLETERLGLRPFEIKDLSSFMELNTDPEVVRYTGDSAFQSEETAREVIASLTKQFHERKMGRFVVMELKSKTWLGWCGLKWHAKEGVADLGYRFFRGYWGKGYATEAARECLNYGFQTLNHSKIVAHAQLENRASVRVLEKLGFKRTGPTLCEGLHAEGFVLSK